MKAFRTRTFSTVVLIGGFFWVVWAGHVPLMLFVLMLQVGVSPRPSLLAKAQPACQGPARLPRA
eukprot:65904-Chlamydomonas_euryale.AAC.1